MLREIPAFDAMPAFADQHLIFLWAGMGALSESDPPQAVYPSGWGAICLKLHSSAIILTAFG